MNVTYHIILVLFLLLWIGCSSPSNNPNQKSDLSAIIKLPEIQYLTINNDSSNVKSQIIPNKSTLLYYFDPDCPHCKEVTKMLLSSKEINLKSTIFFLSNAEMRDIKWYDSAFNISTQNRFVGKDVKFTFLKFINAGAFPLIAVYDEDEDLKKIITGSLEEEIILDLI